MFRYIFNLKVLCVFVLTLANLSAEASEKIQTQTMRDVGAKVTQLLKVYQPEEILVVFDIDNTLLTTDTDLGGDAWFNWQSDKIAKKDAVDLVAPTMDGLLEVQGYLYALGSMHVPEYVTPNLVRSLQQKNLSVFLLTSRGLDFQSFTQRELQRNGYRTDLTSPGPRGGIAATFLPFEVQNPEAACLTSGDLQKMGVKSSLPTKYSDGVYYTSGQNKGLMLRSLLCRLNVKYKAIVFVDDLEKHVDRVLKAYESETGIEVFAFRYGAADARVEHFNQSDKTQTVSAWEKVRKVLSDVFGKQF